MTQTPQAATSETAESFADRIFAAGLGMIDILTTYLGDRLGYYRALAEAGPLTAPDLAARTGTNARYAREWLEQQAVSAIVEVDDLHASADARRYWLPAERAEVLTRPDSLAAMAWLPRLLVASARTLPRIQEAFESGRGVPWSDFGPDAIEGQGDQSRPVFEHLLACEWLPSIPDVHERLTRPGTRVADVCCGVGWSSIAIARGYPNTVVDGFDLDASSVEIARRLAREAGLDDRVSFEVRDAADPAHRARYDVVFAFESIHDLSDPVSVLAAMRALGKQGAPVVVMDERVAEAFTAPGDDVERLMYGYSVLLCLPAGMAEQPSAATGTAMRPDTLRGYARQAGFADVEVLPIDHPFFRFYALTR